MPIPFPKYLLTTLCSEGKEPIKRETRGNKVIVIVFGPNLFHFPTYLGKRKRHSVTYSCVLQ